MPNVVEKRKFVCVEIGSNHNKLYVITLFDNDDVQTEWGRTGKALQSKTFFGAGRTFFDKKIHEKLNKSSKKSYTEVSILDADGGSIVQTASTASSSELKNIAKQQIQYSCPEVAKLIDYLVKVNRHDIYKATGGKIEWNSAKGLFTTPLGIVEPASVAQARTLLTTLGDCVAKNDWKSKSFTRTLEDYLTLVPQDIGMKFIPQNILPDLATVQKQNSILDALEASYDAVTTAPVKKDSAEKKDTKDAPKLFNLKLVLIDPHDTEFKRIDRKYRDSKGNHYDVQSYFPVAVWAVEMVDAAAAFDKYGKPLGNVQELFHGTKGSSVISILSKNLIIPPASSPYVTGRLFGNGVYFSDMGTKSIRYATGAWSSYGTTERVFMFIAQVACGKQHTPNGYQSGNYRLPSGYDSCFAKAGMSGVQHNEQIVYNTAQVNLRYLIEFRQK